MTIHTRPGARRRIAAAAIAALLSVSGCSAAGWGFKGGGGAGKIHLTYALWDPNEQIGYQQSINLFQKLHPNISVTIENIPYNSYQAKITAQYISGDAPDVFWVNTPWLADWVTGGLLADITKQVRAAHIDLSQYYPSLVRLHEHNGKLYGLPKDWDTIALYYNKTYFAKHHITAPHHLTWRPNGSGTFLPFLKRLTVDSNGRHPGQPGFDSHAIKTYAMAMTNDLQSIYGNYIPMNGGAILPHPYATRSVLNSAANRQTMSFLTDRLHRAHVIVPGGQTGPNGDSTNAETLFAQGRTAVWQTGDWLTNSLSQLSTFKIGVLPLPVGPQGRISMFNGLTDGIASNTPHPKAAWELVKWLASARSQRILGSGGFVWPAIERLDPLFLHHWQRKGIDLTAFLEEAHGKTVNFPVATGLGEAINEVTTALGPTFLGTETVASGLKAATTILDYRISQAS